MRFNFSSFSLLFSCPMPFILYIFRSLYTGEIYESNRLHLNPHQFSGSLFYLTSTKEKNYNGSYKNKLLKDQTFKDSIKEKIQETDNINDVIHAINKDYRLGLLLAKEITEKLK